MPNLINKELCCGCSACANKCKTGALKMVADNTGFIFPIVDETKCVECGSCENACPALATVLREDESLAPKQYIVQHKSDEVRYQSTSGGAFTAIAEEIIRQGGVVFGATFADGYEVKHVSVQTQEDLALFRNSKYVQSNIGNTFNEALKYLREGRKVLFSGTPCQVNGLHKFLGKEYNNLYTLDVTCRSIPSPLIFHKYAEYRKRKQKNANVIVFRDKKRGYSFCTMAWYSDNRAKEQGNSVYRRGSESDEWLRLFLKGYCDRLSCSACKYQNYPRVCDFTLRDCWNPEWFKPEWNDNLGTTFVISYSAKGNALLQTISENINIKEIPYTQERRVTPRPAVTHLKYDREKFYDDANTMDVESFFQKYAPRTMKSEAIHLVRYWVWRLHIHNLVRNVKRYFTHRNKKSL